MFRLFNCIVNEHDPLLVALAALICAGTVVSAFKTFMLARNYQDKRAAWVIFTGASSAAGIWATHFVAMLAYNAPVQVNYDVVLTIVSLGFALVGTTTGFWLASNGAGAMQKLGGAVIGVGIAAMHFAGMNAMEVPGRFVWDPWLVVASIMIGGVLAIASLDVLCNGRGRTNFWSAVALMVAAICSLHFTAMTAVVVVPDPTVAFTSSTMDRVLLAMGIAGLTAFGLAAGITAVTIDALRARVADQLVSLEAEVVQRRMTEAAVKARQDAMQTHNSAIADLMQDEQFRSGSLAGAMRALMRALSRGLDAERSGAILLDDSTDAAFLREVYVAGEHAFTTPDTYGTPAHIESLKRSSAKWIVAVDDFSLPNALEEYAAQKFLPAGARSGMHVPIIANGELVGFLTATTLSRPTEWTAEQRLFALSVSNLAALVVERHQRQEVESAARDRAERLARQQVLLNNLMRAEAIRTGDLKAVFGEITGALCREMLVDRVSVRLFGADGEQHVLTEVFNAEENRVVAVPRSGTRPYPEPLSAMLRLGAIAVSDCAVDPLTAGFYETDLAPRRIRAMLHAPVRDGDNVLGVVQCSTYDTPREWLPEDLLLASGIANLVALMTERKRRLQIEDSLREANAVAEEANRAKSQFLANMSHEIRTPMNGVLGMTELLMRSGLNARQIRFAGTIGDSARSLLTIINDILDLSRIEGGKLDLDPQPFELGSCVEDAVELLAGEAHKKGLDLNLFVDQAVLGIVVADQVRLRQVLVNLIGNAIKFTKTGEVSVEVTAAPDSTSGIRFVVRDTGIGIDPVVQAKLFQPFTQADTSITRRFGGTGLGLSISRHLVEMMGGNMMLDSMPGRGTTLSFTLPLVATEANEVEPRRRVRLQGLRILVVDDNATNREIITSYLAESGAVTETADGVAAGIACLEKSVVCGAPFDFALIDYKMGDGDGISMARIVSSTERLAATRLMLLSSMSWSGDAAEARAAGFCVMLNKPIRRQELVACLADNVETGDETVRDEVVDGQLPDEPRHLGMKVLVAEDNPVNQVVAEEFLNTLGCSVVIVENGAEALKVLATQTFDIVLMDCHMPEMDGYSATVEIRAREKREGKPQLPVVAVTANAFEADRLRCLEAGMNGYLSKPYSEAQLAAAMEPYRLRREVVGHTAPALPPRKSEKVLVKAPKAPVPRSSASTSSLAIIPVVRPDLRAKLQRTFVDHAPQLVQALAKAASDGDIQGLALAAHSLKSSSANVGEAEIAGLADAIERGALNGDLTRAVARAAQIGRLVANIGRAAQPQSQSQRPTRRA